jgi:hypothetical protein
LESGFLKTTFWKTNTAKRENTFLKNQTNFFFDGKVFSVDRKVFSLTGKCFPLINFSNGKQTQESLENSFPESEFWKTNMALINILLRPTSFNILLRTGSIHT